MLKYWPEKNLNLIIKIYTSYEKFCVKRETNICIRIFLKYSKKKSFCSKNIINEGKYFAIKHKSMSTSIISPAISE